MADKTKTIQFDMYYNQGYTCIGCAMIADLFIEEEFTDDEIALMKQLVSKIDDEDYSQGIMPLLKEGAPSLYNRLEEAAHCAIYEFLVHNGFRNDYIELDDDELRKNYEKDVEDGSYDFIPSDYYDLSEQPSEEEVEEKAYRKWYEQELLNLKTMDLEWIRSRYDIDNHVEMEDTPDYTVDIPVDFLPE